MTTTPTPPTITIPLKFADGARVYATVRVPGTDIFTGDTATVVESLHEPGAESRYLIQKDSPADAVSARRSAGRRKGWAYASDLSTADPLRGAADADVPADKWHFEFAHGGGR